MRFYMLVMLALIMVLCMIWGAGEMNAAQAQTVPQEDAAVWMQNEMSLADGSNGIEIAGLKIAVFG